MLFFILLVLLPMVFFLFWYSQTQLQNRQEEIRYEKQQLLEQSVRVFSNQLLEADTVSTTFQSNSSLIRLLQNRYATGSDEIFSYLTDVLPTLKSITVSHPTIDATFIYRYTDSALKNSEIDYYLVNIKDFKYDKSILGQIKKNYFVWYAEMDPNDARHDTSYSSKAPTSPKLICFSRIYDQTYSKIVGISELQVNLDTLMESMDFFLSGESLFLKAGGEYYPINFNSERHVQYDKPQKSISAGAGVKNGYGLASVSLSGTNIEFSYRYKDFDVGNPVLLNSLFMAALLLIVPTVLLLMYIYRFTARLVRFSNHIKLMHGENLIKYKGYPSRDEFGVVVAEYNRMTQTITKLIQSVYKAERQKNEASYYAMQSQVNPHFLFNTLENIRQLVRTAEYENVDEMLFALGHLLHYNISMRRESTLLKELEHIRHYLLIYQYRNQNKVDYCINVPEGFEDIDCPFCILQPIVENCFKHGMKNNSDTLLIEITVKPEEDCVIVEICDSGVGMPDEKLESINKSLAADLDIATSGESRNVGLKNVNSRLRIFYGEKYGIYFSKRVPHGLICRMLLGRHPLIDPPTVLSISMDSKDTEA